MAVSSGEAEMGRTLAEIAERYEAERDRILTRIRNGERSASMSGIEYYPKPWAELDVTNDADLQIITVNMTWNGSAHDFDLKRSATAITARSP
jgi:hypothetical protein